MAELEAGRPHIVSDSVEPNRLLGQLWRAVKAAGKIKDFGERGNPYIFVCRGRRALQLACSVTADSAKGSEFGRSFFSHASELGLTMAGCESMGPRA